MLVGVPWANFMECDVIKSSCFYYEALVSYDEHAHVGLEVHDRSCYIMDIEGLGSWLFGQVPLAFNDYEEPGGSCCALNLNWIGLAAHEG